MKTKLLISRMVAASALAITVNSWGYPIYPGAFDGVQASNGLKNNLHATKSTTEKKSVVETANVEAAPLNVVFALKTDAKQSGPYALTFGDLSKFDSIFFRGFGADNPMVAESQSDSRERLLKELKSWSPSHVVPRVWVALNEQTWDHSPVKSNQSNGSGSASGSGSTSAGDNANGGAGAVAQLPTNSGTTINSGATVTGSVGGQATAVPEPGSVALICSGLVGLAVTRRLSKQKTMD